MKPSGLDSLKARQRYLRQRRSGRFGGWWRVTTWVLSGATITSMVVVGFMGLGS